MTHDSHARAQEVDSGFDAWRQRFERDLNGVGTHLYVGEVSRLRVAFNAGRAAASAGGMGRDGEDSNLSDGNMLGELSLLYRHADDDSAQFTRWQMIAAIRHGVRINAEKAGPGLALLVEAAMLFRSYERQHLDKRSEDHATMAAYQSKARRNGAMAGKIEAFIATIDADRLVLALEVAAGRGDVIVIEDPYHLRTPVLEGLEPSPHRAGCECAQCWPVIYATGGMAVSEIKAAIPSVKED